MKVIGVACIGEKPDTVLVEKAKRFVRAVKCRCGSQMYLALGGYWGLMKEVVDEAIACNIPVVLFPPLEREDEHFPEQAFIVKTGMSFRLRSQVFVRSVDVLVALGGEAGTIHEVVTAYLEKKPVLVLVETGLSTDKLYHFAPYIDSRRNAEIKIETDPEALAREACMLVSS